MFHVEQRKQKKMKKEEITKELKIENKELLKLMRLRMIEIKKVHKKDYFDQAIEMINKLKLLEHLYYNYLENEKFIALLEEKLEE